MIASKIKKGRWLDNDMLNWRKTRDSYNFGYIMTGGFRKRFLKPNLTWQFVFNMIPGAWGGVD